jgi:hypothetical protein
LDRESSLNSLDVLTEVLLQEKAQGVLRKIIQKDWGNEEKAVKVRAAIVIVKKLIA